MYGINKSPDRYHTTAETAMTINQQTTANHQSPRFASAALFAVDLLPSLLKQLKHSIISTTYLLTIASHYYDTLITNQEEALHLLLSKAEVKYSREQKTPPIMIEKDFVTLEPYLTAEASNHGSSNMQSGVWKYFAKAVVDVQGALSNAQTTVGRDPQDATKLSPALLKCCRDNVLICRQCFANAETQLKECAIAFAIRRTKNGASVNPSNGATHLRGRHGMILSKKEKAAAAGKGGGTTGRGKSPAGRAKPSKKKKARTAAATAAAGGVSVGTHSDGTPAMKISFGGVNYGFNLTCGGVDFTLVPTSRDDNSVLVETMGPHHAILKLQSFSGTLRLTANTNHPIFPTAATSNTSTHSNKRKASTPTPSSATTTAAVVPPSEGKQHDSTTEPTAAAAVATTTATSLPPIGDTKTTTNELEPTTMPVEHPLDVTTEET
jgi:hypothetical protein